MFAGRSSLRLGHVPGSANIALSGQFASWAGALLGLAARPVLIAESQEAVAEARMRLARVGLEDSCGIPQGRRRSLETSRVSLGHASAN